MMLVFNPYITICFTQLDFVDGIKHVFGKLFDKRDWKQWIVDAERIILHPDYNKNGSPYILYFE